MAEIWKELRDARLEKGVSQQELGVMTGMSISQISQLERGMRDPLNVTVKNLLALADALDVEPMTLIGDRKKEKKSATNK